MLKCVAQKLFFSKSQMSSLLSSLSYVFLTTIPLGSFPLEVRVVL